MNKCVYTCACEQLLCASVRLSCLFTARLYLDVCVNMLLFLQRVIWFLMCQSLDSFTCPHSHTCWSVNDTQTFSTSANTDDVTHTCIYIFRYVACVLEPFCSSEMFDMLTFFPITHSLFITRWIRHMILWCSCRAWHQITHTGDWG